MATDNVGFADVTHGIQREAAAAGKTLSIHVEKNNPARRLYDRLGFREINDVGVYLLMEWTQENTASK